MRHPATRTVALVGVALVAIAASVPLMGMGGDRMIADLLYEGQGGQWLARDSWWAGTLLHAYGRDVVAACWAGVLLAWSLTWTSVVGRTWRRPLAYLLVTTGFSMLVVSALKRVTGLDCPWDLLRYGGERAAIGMFEARPSSMGRAACFPAGHASAGYAWVAAYFALAAVRPRWRWWGLASGLALGAVFGITQQIRGAHFLSHDLWTLAICWLVAAISARVWLHARPATSSSTGDVARHAGRIDIPAFEKSA